MLFEYLRRCEYDSELERHIDQSMCGFEAEEIESLIKTYQNDICNVKSLSNIDVTDSEAIDMIDAISIDDYEQAKADLKIPASLDGLFRSYYGFRMSIYNQDDFLMLDRFEEELFNRLDNIAQKNYNPLCFDDWDSSSIFKLEKLNYELLNRYMMELSSQLLEFNPKLSFMDVAVIVREFQKVYEPNRDYFDLLECFKDCKSFKSLIVHLDDYLSELVFIGIPELSGSHITDLIIECVLTNSMEVQE